MEDKTYETIRLDFDCGAKVFIRRAEEGDGKAVFYTDLPTLKEQLLEYQECYPKLVNVLVDDPEAEENPEADAGMMQAVIHETPGMEFYLELDPVNGVVNFVVKKLVE